MRKYKTLLQVLIIPAFILGCTEQQSTKIESKTAEEVEENVEYAFHELKPLAENPTIKGNLALPPLQGSDLEQNPKKFYDLLGKHLLNANKNIDSFQVDLKSKKYMVGINSPTTIKKNTDYIDDLAKQTQDTIKQANKLSSGQTLQRIEVTYSLPDKSKIVTTFDSQKLIDIQSSETYLILDSVIHNQELTTEGLAKESVSAMCSDILSVEMNPYFCGFKNKDLENNQNHKAAITSDSDKVVESPKTEQAKNTPPPEKKSSLTDAEIQALEEAGFDVKLN